MAIYKIVVRTKPSATVLQIHEVYQSNVGSKVDELLDTFGDCTFMITKVSGG